MHFISKQFADKNRRLVIFVYIKLFHINQKRKRNSLTTSDEEKQKNERKDDSIFPPMYNSIVVEPKRAAE